MGTRSPGMSLHVSLVVIPVLSTSVLGGERSIARVETRDGVPVLVIDGKPCAPVMYRENFAHKHRESSIAHYQRVARAGVRLFLFPVGLGLTQSHEQRVKGWDRNSGPVLERMLQAVGPEARVILLVPTTVRRRSAKKWADENPGEMMVWPPDMRRGDRASISSLKARKLAHQAVADLVKYIDRQPYANRVVGYFFCGAGGEWLDYWDYSPAAEAGFRRWLAARYGNDAALQKAWGDGQVRLTSAKLPAWDELNRADSGLFHDPSRSRRVIDFMRFYHEDLAAAASELAAVAKKACRGTRLVGLWGGYYFFSNWSAPISGTFRRRQGAFDQLVKDPNIDFFMAPYNYRERHPGGVYVPQFLNDTIRLHGKLALVEEDSRTVLAARAEDFYNPAKSTRPYVTIGDSFGRAHTMTETLAVLKRNFAGIFTKPGTGVSWYCLGNQGGWYDDPTVLDTVGRLKVVADEVFPRGPSASQIAVIFSNRSLWVQKLNEYTGDMVARMATEALARLGAPYDAYLPTDLEHPDFPFDRYKLFILANTFYLSPAQRDIIKRRIQADGKKMLSFYAAGFVSDEGLSVDGVRDLTGMDIAMANVTLTKGAEIAITDHTHPTTAGLPFGTRYGTAREFGPLMWCDDSAATPLGELLATDGSGQVFTLCKRGGLCAKKMAGWTSVWSAVPNPPAALLRCIARNAGVHIYDDADDAVYASGNLLGIHTRHAGPRTVRLPRECRVVDALSGKVVCDRGRAFSVTLPARGTGLYLLNPVRRAGAH